MQAIWEDGKQKFVQEDYQSVLAVPYDMPIVGYGNNVVNTLRIWDARPINTFSLDSFDKGDYQKAVEQENLAKTIVEVLYPNDNHYAGKELRLRQPGALARARAELAEEVDFWKAVQYLFFGPVGGRLKGMQTAWGSRSSGICPSTWRWTAPTCGRTASCSR